ncbi:MULTISPECIES: hypothetical protein [unclassified Pseudomonas]|uniref:hypothetical protein n=1 Tax=unclassified Pseudomonas TaxID=196821 RepID=UPI0021CAA6E5|nr:MULTISPECIES: hypothetical protein [unclassified Pseudomonas]MCU1730413.1 hypothetical protein [Pseudomonas sp. 20P_3.2_Bac4]MCU1745628.1 hypothetical protein [Pseudomonas sp. 20P_3.2_Bac5]
MSIINGHGWQNIAVSQHRTLAAIPGADAQAYQSETATASAVSTVSSATASGSASNSTYQDAQDAQDEAFAKLKVVLQNSGSSESDESTGVTASGASTTSSSAAQEFRDYMALSPAEKIRLKMLNELGLTEDDYEALPPEKKEKIDLAIAQRIKDEAELKSMGKAEPQMQAAMAAQNLSASLSERPQDAADPAQARKEKEDREDPLNR